MGRFVYRLFFIVMIVSGVVLFMKGYHYCDDVHLSYWSDRASGLRPNPLFGRTAIIELTASAYLVVGSLLTLLGTFLSLARLSSELAPKKPLRKQAKPEAHAEYQARTKWWPNGNPSVNK